MTDSRERLRGRIALVTGASSGIGEAAARMLVGLGMKVALLARRTERLEALAQEFLGDAIPVVCDLRDVAAIGRAFDAIRAKWGGVDLLVNNAGLGHDAPLTSGDTEHWREMLEVNVLALCVCTREAIADMRRRGDDGHIVHVSSMSAHRVPRGSAVYSATKFAVRSLTEGLRQELRAAKSAIRVSAVSPGYVETEFELTWNAGDAAKARAAYERYPVLTPADIARTIELVVTSPPHMQVHDILVRPTEQPD